MIGSLGYGEDRPASPQLFSAAGGVRTLRTAGILALRSATRRRVPDFLRLVPYMPLDTARLTLAFVDVGMRQRRARDMLYT